jgi:hypothetical protein
MGEREWVWIDQEQAGAGGLIRALSKLLQKVAADAGEQVGGKGEPVEPERLPGERGQVEEIDCRLGFGWAVRARDERA